MIKTWDQFKAVIAKDYVDSMDSDWWEEMKEEGVTKETEIERIMGCNTIQEIQSETGNEDNVNGLLDLLMMHTLKDYKPELMEW